MPKESPLEWLERRRANLVDLQARHQGRLLVPGTRPKVPSLTSSDLLREAVKNVLADFVR